MQAIKLAVMLVALAMSAMAQQPSSNAPDAGSTSASPPEEQSARRQLHANALKLVEASGGRQAMQESLDAMLETGKQKMLAAFPDFDARFADEWVKRMRQRLNFDDFVDVVARVYENYFTSDELVELTRAQLALQDGKTPALSPRVAEKLRSNAVSVQREVVLVTTRLGTRIGGQVGQEIGNEHPEWAKSTKPAVSPGPAETLSAKQ